MSLTTQEINLWDTILRENDYPPLIRQFYTKINQTEKIKQSFQTSVKKLAGHPSLIQKKIEKKVYFPELSEEDIRAIIAQPLHEDAKAKDFKSALEKLDQPVYAGILSDNELSDIVNKALEQGSYDNDIGINPLDFAQRLIDYCNEASVGDEVFFSYNVFNDERYQRFAQPKLARNIVTLTVLSFIVYGGFEKAHEIQTKYAKHMDKKLLKKCMRYFVSTRNFGEYLDEPSEEEYALFALNSPFRNLFLSTNDKRLKKLSDKKPPREPQKDYVTKLNEAFDEAESSFGILAGMLSLRELLKDEASIERTGKDCVQQTIRQRIHDALDKSPHAAYALLYGTRMRSSEEEKWDWTASQLSECVSVDQQRLFTNMVRTIDWNIEDLLSDSYDFHCDNLTFAGTNEINDAYDLHLALARKNQSIPDKDAIQKSVFLYIAVNAKEIYEGRGMTEIVKVLNEPLNKPYIDNEQLKKLFTKIFAEGFEKRVCNWKYVCSDNVAYFHQFVTSPLGEFFEDDKRLEPYFKLKAFLSE